MKSRLNIFLLLIAISFASRETRAERWYSQSMGRWLSRDPIAEPGFAVANNEGQSKTEADPEADKQKDSVYVFVGNNPVMNVDYIGLFKFDGCSPEQQAIVNAAFAFGCKKAKSSAFQCCVGHFNIPQRLSYMCDNNSDITIKCQAGGKGPCKGACAYSYPGGSTIHICGDSLTTGFTSGNCIAPPCILLHEMTHMVGHGFEKWPVKVQNCLGCDRPY